MDYYRLSDDIQSWGNYNEYSRYNNFSGIMFDRSSGAGNPRYEFNTLIEISEQDYRTEDGTGQIYSEDELFGRRV